MTAGCNFQSQLQAFVYVFVYVCERIQGLKNLDGHGIETLDDDEHSDWLGEYRRGCDWEIYVTDLSPQFEGDCLLVYHVLCVY